MLVLIRDEIFTALDRETNAEGRPAAAFTLEVEHAVVAFDDTEDHRQPEARAAFAFVEKKGSRHR
jgi:hypothetical protein